MGHRDLLVTHNYLSQKSGLPTSPTRQRPPRQRLRSYGQPGSYAQDGLSTTRAISRPLGSLLLTIAEIPLERRAIQKLPAFSGPRINSRSSRLSLRLPLRRPAARGLALGSMLWLRSVLRVRPRAISVPLTRNCTELAALDAICRGLSVCNYIRERFRIPLSPPTPL